MTHSPQAVEADHWKRQHGKPKPFFIIIGSQSRASSYRLLFIIQFFKFLFRLFFPFFQIFFYTIEETMRLIFTVYVAVTLILFQSQVKHKNNAYFQTNASAARSLAFDHWLCES